MKRASMRLDPAEADLVRRLRAEGKSPVKELRSQPIDPDNAFTTGIPQPIPFSDVSEAYGIHVWVYACVRAIALAAGSVEILPYIQDSEGRWILNEGHPFHRLLQNPNPYMTARNLREFTFMSQALTGNAYYALERMGGRDVKEIWPLPAGAVKPVSTKENFVDHYVYRIPGSGVDMNFAADEIIHFRDPNPVSLHYGQGSMAPIMNAVTADLNAALWNKSFLGNGAKLDGILESDKPIEQADKRVLLRAWQKMYAGSANTGSTAVLDGGLKYKQLTANVKDMDFVNLRSQLRDEVIASFNVPPAVLGLLEFANYSNMREQMKAFWTNNIVPRLKTHSEMLTLRSQQLTGDKKTVFQEDTSTVEALRANETERATTTKTYVDAGIPINEVIKALDLPFEQVEGGDVPRQPAAPFGGAPVAPGQQQPPQGQPPAPGKTAKGMNPDEESARHTSWKSFDLKLTPHEQAMQTSMRAFFKGQHRRVVKAIQDNAAQFVGKTFKARTKGTEDTVRVAFDIQKENDLMAQAADHHIRGTYFDFAISTAQALKPGFDFNLQDPFALAWIEAKKVKLSQQANAYTLEQISDAVVEGVGQAVAGGFGAGETIAQITDRIDEVYRFAVESRAENIAQTEVLGASNAGAFEGMTKTGVEKKGWLSSRDEKVRDTHRAIEDAGPVGIRENFVSPSGAALQYPGDPQGGPAEICRCRCALVAR